MISLNEFGSMMGRFWCLQESREEEKGVSVIVLVTVRSSRYSVVPDIIGRILSAGSS